MYKLDTAEDNVPAATLIFKLVDVPSSFTKGIPVGVPIVTVSVEASVVILFSPAPTRVNVSVDASACTVDCPVTAILVNALPPPPPPALLTHA